MEIKLDLSKYKVLLQNCRQAFLNDNSYVVEIAESASKLLACQPRDSLVPIGKQKLSNV